jgi:hypothetical protein
MISPICGQRNWLLRVRGGGASTKDELRITAIRTLIAPWPRQKRAGWVFALEETHPLKKEFAVPNLTWQRRGASNQHQGTVAGHRT